MTRINTCAGLVTLMLGTWSVQGAAADGLTVAQYWELTAQRYELALDILQQEGRPANVADEAALWDVHGITASDYYTFRGANADAVDQYGQDHPDVAQEVSRLSDRLSQGIGY